MEPTFATAGAVRARGRHRGPRVQRGEAAGVQRITENPEKQEKMTGLVLGCHMIFYGILSADKKTNFYELLRNSKKIDEIRRKSTKYIEIKRNLSKSNEIQRNLLKFDDILRNSRTIGGNLLKCRKSG